MNDIIFDKLADEFETNIYGSSKGFIRLNVLCHDVLMAVPELRNGGVSVLDIGGGSGHFAVELLKLGNQVTLCEPSKTMLEKAAQRFRLANVTDTAKIINSKVQALADNLDSKFELVSFHAVLEWLQNPQSTLEKVAEFIAPRGYLSLMFYNKNAIQLQEAIAGNFQIKANKTDSDWNDSNVKASPQNCEQVIGWLEMLDLKVESKAGIRIFHDLLEKESLSEHELEELLEFEKKMSRIEPWASLGRHIHLICRKT